MASFHDKIIAAASESARLLHTLGESDYAISASQQNDSYIQELKQEFSITKQNLKKCSRKVESEHRDHLKYQNSHMRRLAYKFCGKKEKFEADASKEEKEWLEAVRVELNTKNQLEQLNHKLAEADQTRSELSSVAQIHQSTQKELDVLYKSIFEGPNPELPLEDQKEHQTNKAEEAFNKAQLQLSTENQARGILSDADKCIGVALTELQSARSAANADIIGFGGSFADMMKHSALSKAQINASQADFMMLQAQRLQPAIQSIGKLDVPEMHFMTDVVFDNIFSDLNAKERIHDSQVLVNKAKQNLAKQLQAADQRVKSAQLECKQAHEEYKDKRNELQRLRASAIDEIANTSKAGHAPSAAPPAYGEPADLPSYEA